MLFNIVEEGKAAVIHRTKKATLLADFNFSTSTRADDFFQFIDCTEVLPHALARDVRSGVITIQHSKVVIAVGNIAPMDKFVNVCTPINLLINALIERIGCFRLKVWVIGILPRPCLDEEQRQIMIQLNRGIKKSVESLARKKDYPIWYLPAQQWLLKRVEDERGNKRMLPDTSLYQVGTNDLNDVGLKHLYLLLAKELRLRKIRYDWEGPPVMFERAGRQVYLGIDGRKIAKKRAAEMECRVDPDREVKISRRFTGERRNAKERRPAVERRIKSVVVKKPSAEEEMMETATDPEERVPLLVKIPGLFSDDEESA